MASHAARTWSQPSRQYDTGANGILNTSAQRAAGRGNWACRGGPRCREPDPCALAAARGERQPGVGRTRPGRAFADPLVVVGTEERVEAESLCSLRDCEQFFVGRALLGLREDAK